jgi:hypothetical protein
MRRFAIVVALTFAPLLVGCLREKTPTISAPKAPVLETLPLEMTVQQRSTTDVPGTDRSLRLTIDDITRGQVVVSLSDKEGRAVLGPTSLRPAASADFTLGDVGYRLTLKELNNALVGDDFAMFVISAGLRNGVTERDKIESLLAQVEAAEGLVFIRNGVEYSGKEAATHLRAKFSAAGSEIATAEEFIARIASRSSTTNEPYRVRRPDGTEVSAGDYLRSELKEIDDEDSSGDNRHGV